MSHLELLNITKTFGVTRAVVGLTLSVERGETVSILGPSGCGKTTTLRIIAGLETPNSGRVLAKGRDITHLPARKRNIGMVFQNYALFPHLNVFENVAFGLRTRGLNGNEIQNRVPKVLERVRLGGFERRAVQELSGGQQQRVALARALAIEPEVLLLDEPLSNLDPSLREEMREHIRTVVRELGVTMVFVTHDQQDAFALAGRVAILDSGICRQVGRPEEIYNRPGDAFVARFLGKSNLLPARSIGGAGAECHLELAPGFTLRTSRPVSNSEKLLVFIRPEHVRVGNSGFATKVLRTQFEGSFVTYVLELGGTTITAREVYRGQSVFREGETVRVEIPDDQFHVLADS